jgi:flagellar biogenesis protein FliO
LGSDAVIRALLSLVLVLGLIAGAGYLVRRFGVQGGLVMKRGARRRLGIVEQLTLDNRRRLVLVKKDDMEHLLLVGGGADLLIESKTAPEPFSLPQGEAS